MMKQITLLKKIEKFLNQVPNRVYGDNYSLASQLRTLIEKEELAISVLQTIKLDAEMAISGEWDCSTDEGKEGFIYQIKLINRVI